MGVLQYSSSKQGDTILVRIGGSLDAETAPKLDAKMRGEIEKGGKRMVCNLEKLEYIASAGLGVLIGAHDALQKKGGELRLSSMNEKVKKIFKLLGFINLFKIYENDEKAIASF